MPKPENVYINCDDLNNLPTLMRTNYLFESQLLTKLLPPKSRVLQVGSMDGKRAIRLLTDRPDLQLTGLEIEKPLVDAANTQVAEAGFKLESIHGDITNPPKLPVFDDVICLNNTLGYISSWDKAIAGMKELGGKVVVSVYGENFSDALAEEYFSLLGLKIEQIQGNLFLMEDFTPVKRFSKREVETFSSKIVETPVGYFCIVT